MDDATAGRRSRRAGARAVPAPPRHRSDRGLSRPYRVVRVGAVAASVGALVAAALLHGTDGARTAVTLVTGPDARDAAGAVAAAAGAPDGPAAGDAIAADHGPVRLVDRLSGAGSRVPRAAGPLPSASVAAGQAGSRAPEPGSLQPGSLESSPLESSPPQPSASEPGAPGWGGPGSNVPERRESGRNDPATRVVPAGCVPAPLTERAAAVLVVGLPGVTGHDEPLAREVVEVGVGGVFLSSTNVRTARQTTALVDGLQDAMAREHGRPLVVSTDEESGRVALARQVVGAGPSPRRLAQTRTPAEVEEFALDAGSRLAELGITLDLAPVLDLDDGPADGVIGDRAFGADPEHVSAYAGAYWRGLASAGVSPTAKHFPGHGRSATDTHASGDVVEATLGELLRTDLVPFARAIEDGVPVVMLNHLGYRALDPHLPASLSPAAYATLREMGFEGVAMTDSLGMGAVHQRWDFPESVVLAIAAGADAALTTDGTHARAMRDALVDAVRTGALEEARLSEASARVTALAGGDPVAMSCLAVELPRLRSGDAPTDGTAADVVPGTP